MLQTGKRLKNKGFLLIEIMISVSILSIGILFILNSFMKPIRAQELSRNYFKAGLLLEEKMFELYNSEITEDSSKAVFPDFNNKFSWDLDIAKPDKEFYKAVNLRIFWNEKNKEQDLTIATYI